MATQLMYAQGQGGFGGHIYDHGGHAGKNGSSFAFRKRFERVDWRKIASVDVDHISRTLDFNALQENIMNITFCNIETELDLRMVDPNFVKLFKLAQLTIEYLLHSQDYLAGLVASNEEKAKKEKEDHNELQKQVEKLQQELSDVKKESHKRKKLLMAQQQMMHAGSGSYNKCPYCTKAFLNSSFLQSHISRRHAGSVGVSKSSSPTHGGSINQTLELELQAIKEGRLTESQLKDDPRCWIQQENKISSVVTAHMQAFKESEGGDHEEIERMKEIFMKELQDVNQKYMASERALVELESRVGAKRSNLGVIMDDDDNDNEKSFLQRQKDGVLLLKEELQHQVMTVESKLKTELGKQEKKWQKKVHKMTKQHADELRKLNDALEHTSRETGKRATTPEARQHQQQVENLLRRSREQEKMLTSQEEILKMEVDKPIVTSQVTHLSVPKSPRPTRPSSPGRMMSMVPSEEDDESTMFGTGSMSNTGRKTLQSTLGTTGTLGERTLGTTQFLEQLRKNPTLKIMHDEFASLLDEQVAKRGIPHGTHGITQQVLDNKLAMMKTQRQSYVKKFPDFEALRQYYDRIAEQKALEKVRAMKTSPPLPPRNLNHSLPSSHIESQQSSLRSPAQTPARSPSPRVRSPQPQGRNPGFSPPKPPKPAPRSTTPQRTLQSTGSTTEWTSTQWDSEEESEEEEVGGRGQPIMVTPSKSNRQPAPSPSPRPRGQVIQSRPLHDIDDDDWDDSESMVTPKPAPVKTRVIMSQPKGQKVSELSRSIESQLVGRKKGDKPFGGVDTMERTGGKKTNNVDILEDIDGSDWDVSPVEDEEPQRGLKRPPTRNSNRGSHAETDFSTNTYGTSVWGSSSKAASTAHNRASTSKSSFITDVSSDEELDLDNI
ncbi:zinc finger protein DZIP1L-like [Haliotis rubra]|uniref:zinc finger protein DZIP1L-like n=1 Tax=Haliotis rubra TaxID=36100 RepID=UPI001EE57A4D|nr:zinc finger protein DZIP1L-like [Haliotis rubra]